MRLTQYTDYSLRVLIHLGLCPDRLATIQEISEAYEISKNHLMKVVQRLAKNGYIESVRGQGGGLRLKHPPAQIRLGEVIQAMEPDFGVVECLRSENRCAISPACKLPAILRESMRLFTDNLDRYTLADLLPARSRSQLMQLLNIGAAG